MDIRALMVDVDGVLVNGRPEDGNHWSTTILEDLGLSADEVQRELFAPHWDDIVRGRAALMDRLAPVLQNIAPHVSPDQFVTYWFRQDSRLNLTFLTELASIRSAGIQVWLATNQEHMRAAYLMQNLGLSQYVDGIHYSAQLGFKKPSREFFAMIVESTGFTAAQLLLVDDSLDNLNAAADAGWNVFRWTKRSLPAEIRAVLEG
jgi:putative hydrolase of the HAD superfamily